MEDLIKEFLEKQSGKTVMLADLERQMPGYVKYRQFACSIKQLMQEGVLIPIGKPSDYSLFNKYRIDKRRLKNIFWEEISKRQLSLHSAIDLGCYFKTSPAVWKREQKWLDKLNQYLSEQGLPEKEVSVWERSYEIIADEKWISRNGGKGFLSGITNLEKQLHLPDRQYFLYYFGDLDWEGITIWYLLDKRRPTRLALPFYQAPLRKEFAPGKEQQRHDLTAYQSFLSHLPLAEQELLAKLLQTGCCSGDYSTSGTRLAEGKFLRDYFPVIYSCRLRSFGGTAIMDKELKINQAFFQDNEPEFLKRLG